MEVMKVIRETPNSFKADLSKYAFGYCFLKVDM